MLGRARHCSGKGWLGAGTSLSTKGAMCTQLVELPPALPVNTSGTKS